MTTITTIYGGQTGLEAHIGDRRLAIDLPEKVGAGGRGFTPVELFVASLGSCVTAFVGAYCATVGLDSRDLSVDVSFQQENEEPTSLSELEVTVNLPHAECGEREVAIRRVAEHCPVHETVEFNLKTIDFQVRDKAALERAGAGG